MFREMEEQRKKRKDTDQEDGPEEEEVMLLYKSELFENSKTLLCLGSHKREPCEAVRITGKCKARTKERLKKEINNRL